MLLVQECGNIPDLVYILIWTIFGQIQYLSNKYFWLKIFSPEQGNSEMAKKLNIFSSPDLIAKERIRHCKDRIFASKY